MYKFLSESKLETILRMEIKKLGGRCYKWISPGNVGVPDRIIILKGMYPIFVELKTDKGKLSPIQEIQIRTLKELDQQVYTTYGIEGIIELFRILNYFKVADRLKELYEIRTT